MKKWDGFFALNIALVAILSYTYFYSSKSLDYFENNPELKAKYQRTLELKTLKSELKKISHQKAKESDSVRAPSSVEPPHESEVSGVLDSEGTSARKHYSKVRETCSNEAAEIECLKQIDLIITQFPESVWAAETLIIYVDILRQNNRIQQADEIIEILKGNFHAFKSVQAKVNYLEGVVSK